MSKDHAYYHAQPYAQRRHPGEQAAFERATAKAQAESDACYKGEGPAPKVVLQRTFSFRHP